MKVENINGCEFSTNSGMNNAGVWISAVVFETPDGDAEFIVDDKGRVFYQGRIMSGPVRSYVIKCLNDGVGIPAAATSGPRNPVAVLRKRLSEFPQVKFSKFSKRLEVVDSEWALIESQVDECHLAATVDNEGWVNVKKFDTKLKAWVAGVRVGKVGWDTPHYQFLAECAARISEAPASDPDSYLLTAEHILLGLLREAKGV